MKKIPKSRFAGCIFLAAALSVVSSVVAGTSAVDDNLVFVDNPVAAGNPAAKGIPAAGRNQVTTALPAADEGPASADASGFEICLAGQSPEMKLAHLDREIAERALALNRLVWESYLEYAERGAITPDVLDYPGLDYRAVRDTVPGIARLHVRYLRADSLYTRVLERYPGYGDIHREYVALKGVNDRERQNRNKERYNLMYRYLRDNDPDYLPAYERRQEAIRMRNMAVVRLLAEYYRSQGREMPTEPLIASGSYLASGSAGPKVSMRYLRREYPAIERAEVELRVLQTLRTELFEQAERRRYDLKQVKSQASLSVSPSARIH